MAITSPIFNLFGRSPIRPLQHHMDKVNTAAEALSPFIDAVLDNKWDEAEKQQQIIVNLEKEADHLKRELRLNLPNGLFLPVARADILELLNVQDRIANKAQDIAGLIFGRRMQIPGSIADNYKKFLSRCVDASRQACAAINELDELLETGFRGNEVDLVEKMIRKLDEIEHDTDDMQVEIRRQVFDIETELSPIDVIFLYKVIERTGDLADCAQTVGGRLQLLLAR